MKKVVLAFSGGLDTSYCVKYLKDELGLEVHSAIVNTGGFSEKELKEIELKAIQLGVDHHQTLEQTQNFYDGIVKYLVFGNVLKNHSYPLSVSAERIHQAMALSEYAKSINANYIAHGSTGAGNDQVRFDLIFQLLIPNIEILTPIRDQKLSRKEEIDYLKKHGVDLKWEKAKYSINKGLWGTSVGGAETLTSHQSLPNEAYPTPTQILPPKNITLHFEEGELKGVNGKQLGPVMAIRKIEELAAPFGIGRDIHVGDTIIGIKGRVGFEAPAPHVILKAHQALEKHTLSKWQLHWKEQLANWYGMFIHEAMYFEPVMRNIESFLEETQKTVSGEVYVQLLPNNFKITGIKSEFDLMDSDFGDYGELNNNWTGDDVKGFTKIMSNSLQLFHAKNPLT